jgi:hypothetical protein
MLRLLQLQGVRHQLRQLLLVLDGAGSFRTAAAGIRFIVNCCRCCSTVRACICSLLLMQLLLLLPRRRPAAGAGRSAGSCSHRMLACWHLGYCSNSVKNLPNAAVTPTLQVPLHSWLLVPLLDLQLLQVMVLQ